MTLAQWTAKTSGHDKGHTVGNLNFTGSIQTFFQSTIQRPTATTSIIVREKNLHPPYPPPPQDQVKKEKKAEQVYINKPAGSCVYLSAGCSFLPASWQWEVSCFGSTNFLPSAVTRPTAITY